MKTKLFYLVMAIFFTLTSCQKEDEFTGLVDAVDTTNQLSADATEFQVANSGTIYNGNLTNSNSSSGGSNGGYIDSNVNLSFPFMVRINNSNNILNYYDNPGYTGSMQTPTWYDWDVTKKTNTSISVVYDGTNSSESFSLSRLTNSSDYYSVELTVGYSTGEQESFSFCFNNYGNNITQSCGDNSYIYTILYIPGGPGQVEVAAAGFFLP